MQYLPNISSPKDIKSLSLNELNILAKEIRETIIDTVAENGGHLAPNLGVVELTIALHKVLKSPEDKIIWDVSHQSYAHKLLTGRYDSFKTIRKYNGISGYTNINESEHDAFGAGHSSTSLSAALGMAVKRDLSGENHRVVAVIGDGALTGGMAWEALNHIGHIRKKMTVVINDNQMSIAPNVGAMSHYLNHLRTDPGYSKVKENVSKLLENIPLLGSGLKSLAEKMKNSLKYLVVKGLIFEELGFTYIGPIDGHDIAAVETALEQSNNISKPVIIHCLTKKGYGYQPASKSPDVYHGISPFEIETGKVKSIKPVSFSKTFGERIVELAREDEKIIAITAAMESGVGLSEFAKQFKDKFFDVGISEQHATTLAAGMAAAGLKPVFAVYSTFLQRAYDQVLHDIALQELPVVLAIDRAGLVGDDGATHHGVFDLSYLRNIPNMTILAPSNGDELKQMLSFAFNLGKPCAIRYPRGRADILKKKQVNEIKLGKADIINEGSTVLIWAIGRMVSKAKDVAIKLEKMNINPTIVDSRFLKPFDEKLFLELARTHSVVISIEDNVTVGGMGDLISDLIVKHAIDVDYVKLGIPDKFITHGSISELDKSIGLDTDSIVIEITRRMNKLRLVGEENTLRQIINK